MRRSIVLFKSTICFFKLLLMQLLAIHVNRLNVQINATALYGNQ